MDPGNWATDIAGGSRFGYTLLFVIMASNLMAILLQSLALKLGVATERDLAQLCHESYGRRVSFALWVVAEIAIAACDLAEVIGSAIALQLLFHIPLLLRRADYRARCAADPAPAALGIPLRRGAGDCADRDHLRAVRRADVSVAAGVLARAAQPVRAFVVDRDQSRNALHRHRHSGRDGDAAQSLSAFVDCAEPAITSARPRASARPFIWPIWIRRWH